MLVDLQCRSFLGIANISESWQGFAAIFHTLMLQLGHIVTTLGLTPISQVVCRGPGCTCVVCSTSRAMGRFGSVRMTHCDCPGVESATKSADITIVYDPDQLDRFLECADAIEAAYPSLIVEGGEYLRMQGVSPAQDRELAGTALDLQVSRAEVSNAKRRPILARGGFCAVEGEQGQFDIAGDSGEVVYRPLTAGHFPTPEDVTAIVSARIKVEESA